jgi:hypothetical protein
MVIETGKASTLTPEATGRSVENSGKKQDETSLLRQPAANYERSDCDDVGDARRAIL